MFLNVPRPAICGAFLWRFFKLAVARGEESAAADGEEHAARVVPVSRRSLATP